MSEPLRYFIPLHITGNYMFKVNNRNTRTRCKICSKLTVNAPEQRHWRYSGVFIVNFQHISHFALVFLLLTFSQVNAELVKKSKTGFLKFSGGIERNQWHEMIQGSKFTLAVGICRGFCPGISPFYIICFGNKNAEAVKFLEI